MQVLNLVIIGGAARFLVTRGEYSLWQPLAEIMNLKNLKLFIEFSLIASIICNLWKEEIFFLF